MSTRGLVSVVKDKKIILSVYSGSDSYFESLGDYLKNIINDIFLNKKNLNTFLENVAKLTIVDEVNNNYYNIDNVWDKILNNEINKIVNEFEFSKDTLFCEWHYIFNLDENVAKIVCSGQVCWSGSFKEYLKLTKNYFKDF